MRLSKRRLLPTLVLLMASAVMAQAQTGQTTADSVRKAQVNRADSLRQMAVRMADSTRQIQIRMADSTRRIQMRLADSTREIQMRLADSTRQIQMRMADSTRQMQMRLADSAQTPLQLLANLRTELNARKADSVKLVLLLRDSLSRALERQQVDIRLKSAGIVDISREIGIQAESLTAARLAMQATAPRISGGRGGVRQAQSATGSYPLPPPEILARLYEEAASGYPAQGGRAQTLGIMVKLIQPTDSLVTDPGIADIASALKGMFSWRGYRVLDQGWVLLDQPTGSRPSTATLYLAKGRPYRVAIQVDAIGASSVKMSVSLDGVSPATNAGRPPDEVLRTTATISLDKTVVLGASKGLILAVTPRRQP